MALNAERHAFELWETPRDARAAIANVDAWVDRLLDQVASIREDLATTARRLTRSIVKAPPTRRADRGSFSALSEYLELDDLGRKRDDLLASWSGLVASHETAALEMEAVARSYALAAAAPSRTTEDPVYHVILSTRPGEAFDIEQAKLAVDSVRQSLDADRHQYFAALHYDVDTDRYHVHVAINKVSLYGRVLDRWQDYAKLGRAAECQIFPDTTVANSYPIGLAWGPYESLDSVDLSVGGIPAAKRRAQGALTEPPPPLPCTADSLGNCALEQSYSTTSSCQTAFKDGRGAPISVYAYKKIFSIYSTGRPPVYRETATSNQTLGASPGCAVTTRWGPGEPRVQYNDVNLP